MIQGSPRAGAEGPCACPNLLVFPELPLPVTRAEGPIPSPWVANTSTHSACPISTASLEAFFSPLPYAKNQFLLLTARNSSEVSHQSFHFPSQFPHFPGSRLEESLLIPNLPFYIQLISPHCLLTVATPAISSLAGPDCCQSMGNAAFVPPYLASSLLFMG